MCVCLCVSSTCWIGLGGPCFDNVCSRVRVCSSQVTGQLNIGDELGTHLKSARGKTRIGKHEDLHPAFSHLHAPAHRGAS